MGLFDFVKEAGARALGRDEPEAAPQVREFDAAKLARMKQVKALRNLVAELGLEVEELQIEVEGDTAIVQGKVDDQAEREKVVLAIGNVIGIARVDDRLEARKVEPEAVLYTVKSGDSLSMIAREQYGDAGKYPVIFEANKPMLTDPNKIYPGQVLRIPPLES
jgi:nucleoid-associated protein YgaU